jgi:uncharacterized membrane protein
MQRDLFMTFLFYSFAGWVWETIYCSIKARRPVYRGFLLGPYTPVYGFAVTTVLLLLSRETGTIFTLFINSMVIATVFEFLASYLLEKLFHLRLWDYSTLPLNIEGRVAVPVSLFWGFGCVVLVKVVEPLVNGWLVDFAQKTNELGPIILFLLFMADVISTFFFNITEKAEVEAKVDMTDTNNQEIKEWRLKHLISNHESAKSRLHALELLAKQQRTLRQRNLNRILKNYPNMRFRHVK